VGVLVSGVLAQWSSPPVAVAASGSVGVLAAVAAGGAWRRARRRAATNPRRPDRSTGHEDRPGASDAA
jgi:hypothetical protein